VVAGTTPAFSPVTSRRNPSVSSTAPHARRLAASRRLADAQGRRDVALDATVKRCGSEGFEHATTVLEKAEKERDEALSELAHVETELAQEADARERDGQDEDIARVVVRAKLAKRRQRELSSLIAKLADQATTNPGLVLACERDENAAKARKARVLRQTNASRTKAPKKVWKASNHRRTYTSARHI